MSDLVEKLKAALRENESLRFDLKIARNNIARLSESPLAERHRVLREVMDGANPHTLQVSCGYITAIWNGPLATRTRPTGEKDE